jgi:hypothetical protein
VGAFVGVAVGAFVGVAVGVAVGALVGVTVGCAISVAVAVGGWDAGSTVSAGTPDGVAGVSVSGTIVSFPSGVISGVSSGDPLPEGSSVVMAMISSVAGDPVFSPCPLLSLAQLVSSIAAISSSASSLIAFLFPFNNM